MAPRIWGTGRQASPFRHSSSGGSVPTNQERQSLRYMQESSEEQGEGGKTKLEPGVMRLTLCLCKTKNQSKLVSVSSDQKTLP